MSKKLADTFNIDDTILEEHESALSTLDIPENPTLDDIARISLEVFTESLKGLENTPAIYKARTLEVSKQYLDLSKDAIYRKQDLRQRDEKLKLEAKKIDKKSKTDDAPKGTVSRLELARGTKKGQEGA